MLILVRVFRGRAIDSRLLSEERLTQMRFNSTPADDDSNESKDTTDFTFAPTNNSGSLRPAKSNTDLGTPRGNRSMIMTV